MKIEIWSDVVCPFCYIGKRHFEAALAQFTGKNKIEIEWKSFQLDSQYQHNEQESTDQTARLAKKYNRPYEEMKAMQQNIINTASTVGLDMKLFDAIQFNTLKAHRIIQKAKEKNLGDKAEETFFKSYFTDLKNLNNDAVLEEISLNIGLTKEDINDALTNDIYAFKVTQDIQEAQQIGVTGVPFFVFNRKYGISGAQPIEVFTQTLNQSFEEWENSSPKVTIQKGENSCDIDGNC